MPSLPMPAERVGRLVAALAVAGAGVLHWAAAADHGDHPHVLAFFVTVAGAQILWP